MWHEPTASRTQDAMRVLPEAIPAREVVAEALFRTMPQDGLRAHGHRTLTCAGPSTAVSQKAETETGDNTMSDSSWWLDPTSCALRPWAAPMISEWHDAVRGLFNSTLKTLHFSAHEVFQNIFDELSTVNVDFLIVV